MYSPHHWQSLMTINYFNCGKPNKKKYNFLFNYTLKLGHVCIVVLGVYMN